MCVCVCEEKKVHAVVVADGEIYLLLKHGTEQHGRWTDRGLP